MARRQLGLHDLATPDRTVVVSFNRLELLIMMLGGFYVVQAASLFPALFIAAILMAHSRIEHPYRVFASIVAGSALLALLLRWALRRSAWELINPQAVEVSFVLEVLLAATLAGIGVLFLYVYRRFCLHSHESITGG